MAACGNESCCTRPVLSSVLTALTLATFTGAICFLIFEAPEDKCSCDGLRCCAESTSEDRCADDECYCPFVSFFEDGVCREQSTEFNRAKVAVFFVLIAIGIALIVASSISCCCWAKTTNKAHYGPRDPFLQGVSTVEMGKP